MYIYIYIQLHTCMLCISRAFPWWNAEMTCFICFCNSSFNQPWGLRLNHVYSLLQMFSEVTEKHLQKSLPIMKLKGYFLEKTEMNTMRFFWESWRTWPMTSFKVQVLGNFISQTCCSSSEKLQFLYGCMMSGCGKPPQMSISHSLCIANMSW